MAPLSIALGLAVLPVHAALVHRWSFNEAPGGAPNNYEMIDSESGWSAFVKGQDSTFDGTTLRLTGTSNGNHSTNFLSGYVDLPNGIISSKTNLTVEVWATPEGFANFARIFDFGRVAGSGFGNGEDGEIIDNPGQGQIPGTTGAEDTLYLTFCRAGSLNEQRMDAFIATTTGVMTDTNHATTSGIRHHYAMTFEDGVGNFGGSGGRVRWFRGGVEIASADVDFHLNELEDVNNWLGRSQWTGDTLANASYDEFRIYDHALTQSELLASINAGPDSLSTTPVSAPAPDNLWIFDDGENSELASGAEFVDTIGSEIATVRGQGATLTQTELTLPGTTDGNQPGSTISAYLDLPNGIVSATPGVTFEAWVTPLSSNNWQRLFDFGRCTGSSGLGAEPGEIIDGPTAPGGTSGYDNLSLSLNDGGNMNSQQLEGEFNDGGPIYTFSPAVTTAGTEYHYVLVIEDGIGEFGASGCRASWYRDGILQNTDDFPFLIQDIQDVNNWIGRSMYSGDSNSNLALNELRIHRRALAPAETVASFLAGADPTAGPPEPPAPAPVPARRWDFNTPVEPALPDTEFIDAATGEVATVRGNGAQLDGSQLVIGAGLTNGQQTGENISAYLELPDHFVSGFNDMTVELWLTPLSSNWWQRILDFGNCTVTHGTGAEPGEIIDGPVAPAAFEASDNLFLSLNAGGTLGEHRLAAKLNAGGETGWNSNLSASTSTGQEYHIVMTVENGAGGSGTTGCEVKWYRDGVLQTTISVPFRLKDMEDVNNWIGRSNWSGDSNSHMAINELRVYDRAITQKEVNTSETNGPDAVFPPPVAINDSATLNFGQKVLVDILANDTGGPLGSTVSILSPPAAGTVTVQADGSILYAHDGSATATDSLIYEVSGIGGTSAPATVDFTITSELKIANPSLAMPDAPPPTSWELVDALPGLTFNEPLCISLIPGNDKRMFVCERMAKIKHVPDVTSASPTQNTFLDLQAVVAGRTPTETIEDGANAEHGLLGLAFHPDYATNGYFYVAYTVRINGGSYYQRVSRFEVSTGDPDVADPASESVLIEQLDEGSNHDGGDLHFGPDGYLYYAAGDEENSNRGQQNSQKVDGDFFCGVFRIDVDKLPGNLEPNPHASIPTDGGIARFSIPADNPFIHTSLGGTWDGAYNGIAVADLNAVRTEFWATGLRHVWRMSFDPATGDLWAGDVGQNTYEEINLVEKGVNYGWAYREGAHDFGTVLGSPPPGFSSTDPVYEYVHTGIAGGDASFKGNSVVGGYVYRGTRFPELVGRYIFSDSVSGHVWEMETGTGATTRLTGLPGAYGVISSQGLDPYNQDLLFCAYLTGKIMRLTKSSDLASGFPQTLSETGLFADLSDLSPSPGLVPYLPNLKFWSDHADKTRWFAIPDGTSRMTWQKEGPWDYPTGAVWVKHFDLALSRDDPGTNKRIETRVLVKTDDGVYGVSYRWNDAGTEAYLVEDAGTSFDLAIDDHGTPHTQRWEIPGRTSCLTCHDDRPLSFNTRQLNRIADIHGMLGNQIVTLSSAGYLDNSPDPVDTLPFHVTPEETQYPLEQRVRSYLDVNCAYCHQLGGSVAGFWDGRESLTLEQTGLIHGTAVNNGGDPFNKYVVPGDTFHSIVLNRVAETNGFTRMPPLATSEHDEVGIDLLTQWIQSELPSHVLYDDWAINFPGIGGRNDDGDGDGRSNYDEFVLGTNPLSASDAPVVQAADGSLSFNRKAFRIYDIRTSTNLVDWESWNVPENTSIYETSDRLETIALPIGSDPARFFQLNVVEP
ncbi:soluble aldose sugar dehydrogenase YliI precursor [Haloferula helveola]|uniref:Soluble aldose sugar dehydrogenase YliI n=1 Tax=Haloferula helveola TaxID=490095 RepID=A0ABM7R9V8_9BACT|nr:soluble aldose sugar dehydrogenase YliI precursor [Haloferula helveola]